MAGIGAVQVRCPECGLRIPITLQSHATAGNGGGLVIEVDPDLTDVMAHAWTHEQ